MIEQPKVHTRASVGQIAAVVAGNSLEYYDFMTYAYFAVYIGRTFFPSADAGISLLASLATFGAGFGTRPLGAILIGRFGDRVGRKPAMLLSFGLMGLAVIGLALTPSYATIGLVAPVLVVMFRLLQGFAMGGEAGPATSFLFEIAPPHRRGLYVSLQYVGSGVAGLCAGLVGVALAANLSDRGLELYGWRIAMLLGALVIPFGLILRRTLPETLHEVASDLAPAQDRAERRAYVLIGVLALIMISSGVTVSYVLKFMTTYALATLHMPAGLAFGATAIGGVAGICLYPLGGALSDRLGRKPVMIGAWVVMLLAIFPCFYLLSHFRNAPALYGTIVLLGGAGATGASATLATFVEALPSRVRSGVFGLVYALSVSVFGGTAQFNAAWLIRVTGDPMAPAWYMIVSVAIGLVAMFNISETAPATQHRRR